jgi:methylmalonyl-CoA mutase
VASGDDAGAVAAFLKAHPTTRWALSCGGEHEQGAGAVLELALLTHRAARWLEALADHDLPPGEALNRLSLWLHAGVHMPETLAKIRALHRLFQRVGDILEVTGRPGVHTITSQHMLSGQDPDTNMVRHACAGLAAAVGGADGLCVRAHDPHGTETQAPRVARNLALMIAHESRIAGFADPAAGSGHFEALTDRLARDAWALFQDLRTAGDGAEALAAERLGRDREAVKAYWTGRTVVGVNAYPPPEPQAPGPLEQLLGMAP